MELPCAKDSILAMAELADGRIAVGAGHAIQLWDANEGVVRRLG
jgi:hypothetical protein